MTTTPITDAAYLSMQSAESKVDALLACSEKLERENIAMREALEKIQRHGPIMGSRGDYRQGQLDILETVSTIAGLSLVNAKGES